MSKLFYLQPLNEGQDLNYIEKHLGTIETARKRAKAMLQPLQHILKDGTISIEIQDEYCNTLDIL